MPNTPGSPTPPEPMLRFAELMACLAAATELAMGQSADQALHGVVVAMRLADSERRDVYYQAQLRFIGCNANTQWMAEVPGDVLELRRAGRLHPRDACRCAGIAGRLGRLARPDEGTGLRGRGLSRPLRGGATAGLVRS